MIPMVASAADLPDAVAYAETRPSARWYVAKRAVALGDSAVIPASWGEAITAALTDAAELDSAQRESLGKKGEALKNADGSYSYPIRNRVDLAKAVKAYGRAKNKAAVRKHIVKQARALHATDILPDSWKPLTAAAIESDESGLWVAQVRDLITQAGSDPDEIESGTDGYLADFEAYQDTPDAYVQELLAAHTDIGEGDEVDMADTQPATEETATEELSPVPGIIDVNLPETQGEASVTAELTPLAASVSQQPGPYVNVYTTNTAPAQVDVDALTAAIKEAVAESLTAAKAISMDAPPVAAEPAASEPQDLEAAKAALREKFGKLHPHRKAVEKPQPAPLKAPLTAASARSRLAEKRAAVAG